MRAEAAPARARPSLGSHWPALIFGTSKSRAVSLVQQRSTVGGLKALDQARKDIESLREALGQLKNAAIDAAATSRFTASISLDE